MRFSTLACWTVLLCAQPLSACDPRNNPDGLSLALATAQPFASKFASYETWVVRATSVSHPAPSNAALTEALFAPIRNDGVVLAAWVRLPTRQADEFSFPPKLTRPETRDWTQVRDPLLGWIRVTRHAHCPLALPKGWRNGAAGCVLLTRDPDHQPANAPTITLGFVDSAG